jgi:four helix bundle protein
VGVRRFQDLVAWQLCLQLCHAVFVLTEDGPAAGDDTFRTQIRDAAKSAPSLIAEGFLRFTAGEFIRYLRMARGEIGEVQNNLHVGIQTGYFPAADAGPALILADRAMGTTTNLLKSKLKQQGAERRAERDRKTNRQARSTKPRTS